MEQGDQVIVPPLSFGAPKAKPATVEETRAINEQRTLGSLAEHPGWELFKRDIEKRILALRTLSDADLTGLSYEEVGQRYLVGREASAVLQSELAKVEALARVRREHSGT